MVGVRLRDRNESGLRQTHQFTLDGALVAIFEPDEETRETIENMLQKEPVALEVIEDHEGER